jgi:hypothetical protein
MTAGKRLELYLRGLAFTVLCVMIGFIFFLLIMWFLAIIQIGITIFSIMGANPFG